MAHDYTNLDNALLSAIGEKPSTFTGLQYRVEAHSEAISKNDPATPWRIVDRRLQVLRKSGKIRYQRKPEGWVLVEA